MGPPDSQYRDDQPLTSVASVLAMPELQRGVPEVVAGGQGLDRPVRWVHAGEAADIAALLKGGELLLTTGLGIRPAPEKQRLFVNQLAERDIAGVVIELGTQLSEVPPSLVAESDAVGLPVIALHREVRFVDITEAVHREIVNRQFELMRRGDEAHRRFRSLLLAGAGAPEVLDSLAETVANPVVLERIGHGVLYHSSWRLGGEETLSAWESVRRGLGGAPAIAEAAIPVAGDPDWGRIVALAVDSPLDDFARVAVERAAELIALALLRDREEERSAGRERGNFFLTLLGEESVDEAATRERAKDLGFDHRGRILPMVVARSAAASAGEGSSAAAWSRLWNALLGELRERRLPVLAGTREHERELLSAVGVAEDTDRSELMERVAGIAHRAALRHIGSSNAVVVCAGPAVGRWSDLARGLRSADVVLAAAVQMPPRSWHDVTVPDVERVLWSLREQAPLRDFAEARLGPLKENDARRTMKLVETLSALCSAGGRRAETARALGIERQSLYHRLGRIEDLLSVDLTDGNTLFELHLALRIDGLLGR